MHQLLVVTLLPNCLAQCPAQWLGSWPLCNTVGGCPSKSSLCGRAYRALDLKRHAVRVVGKQMHGALDGMAVPLTRLPMTPFLLLAAPQFDTFISMYAVFPKPPTFLHFCCPWLCSLRARDLCIMIFLHESVYVESLLGPVLISPSPHLRPLPCDRYDLHLRPRPSYPFLPGL